MATDNTSHGTHVLPVKTYLAVAGGLFVLTIITVAASFVHFGAFNLVIAMGIATIKATMVALIFMHLMYDDKLYLTIFVMALLMLSLFIVITLFDTLRRGDIYQEVAQPLKQEAVIYESMGADSTAAGHHAADSAATDSAAQSAESAQQH